MLDTLLGSCTRRRSTPRVRGLLTSAATSTIFLAAAACGPSAGGGPEPGGGLDGPDRNLAFEFDSLYTVGALDGEDWETFGSLGQVAFDAAGNLYVFDRQGYRVVVVGPDGSLMRTVGKQGEGPGEFQRPSGMAVGRDGSVVVADWAAGGFTIFGPDGEFVETARFDPSNGIPSGSFFLDPGGEAIYTQGTGIVVRNDGDDIDMPSSPNTVPIRRISLENGTDSVVHEAWKAPRPEATDEDRISGTNEGGGRMVIQMAPLVAFQPSVDLGMLPDGRLVLFDSTAYKLDVLAPDGSVQRSLERPIEPVPVTEAMREKERERRLTDLEENGSSTRISFGGASLGSGVADQLAEMQRSRIERMLFADVVPVLSEIRVDWEGRIWVERNAAEPGEEGPIDLIDPSGLYYGTVAPEGPRIPDAFGPDGLVAYIETDEYDVPSVRVMRLETPFD